MWQSLSKLPTIKLVIYVLFIAHLLLCGFTLYDAMPILSSDWTSWYPFVVVIYTIVWAFCLRDNKKAYYTYLLLCFLQVALVIFSLRTQNDLPMVKTFFPLNIFFAFALLVDLKRLMSHARTR